MVMRKAQALEMEKARAAVPKALQPVRRTIGFQQDLRICLQVLYLRLSTPTFVRARSCHYSFTSSLITVVLEY
jgi:hypothetical protein